MTPPLLYVGQKFATIDDLEKQIELYQKQELMLWSIWKSTSVEATNRAIIKAGRTDTFPRSIGYTTLKYECYHGKDNRTGKGNKIRPKQSTVKLNCPAYLQMTCKRNGLVVKILNETHNHERTKARFEAMSRNRSMPKDTAEKARLLMEGGVKPSVVRNILRDLGAGRVTQRDLANLRAKWKREANGGATEEECFIKSLEDILEADEHASIMLSKEDDGTLKYVFIQTSAMRKNVELYGRVIILDHSYKINKNRMPVCCIMVMDGAGSGRSAGYAFVLNERGPTVEEVVTCFREAITEPLAEKVKTFVIDKDPSEIAAIRAVFPNAQVQLCLFHTGKTLKEKSAKENAETKDAVDRIKYAPTESEYNSLKSDILEHGSPEFIKYFLENWDTCPLAWSYKDKKKSMHLGNTTTNRVENHNSKIKLVLNRNSTLADAVRGIVNIVQNKEEDVFFRDTMASMKRTYDTSKPDDPIINEILNDVHRFCADLLVWEYENHPVEEEMEMYNPTEESCSCEHWTHYELPCKHIFHRRRMAGTEIYRKAEIAPMWKISEGVSATDLPSEGIVKVKQVPKEVQQAKTPQLKFKLAKQTTLEISSLLSECGDLQFKERHQVLSDLFTLWGNGHEVVVTPKLDASTTAVVDIADIPVLHIVPLHAEVNNDDREKGTENITGANPNEEVDNESRENSDDTGENLDQELKNDGANVSDANSNYEMNSDCDENSDEGTDEFFEIIDDSIAYGKKKIRSPVLSTKVQEQIMNEDIYDGIFTAKAQVHIGASADDSDSDSLIHGQNYSISTVEKEKKENSILAKSQPASQSASLSPNQPPNQSPIHAPNKHADQPPNQSPIHAPNKHADQPPNQSPIRPPNEHADQPPKVSQNKFMEESAIINSVDLWGADDNVAMLAEFMDSFDEANEPGDPKVIPQAVPVDLPVLSVDTPLCRCQPRLPSVKKITRQDSGTRMAGRPYYVCATKQCGFWQIAKSPRKQIPKPKEKVSSQPSAKKVQGSSLPSPIQNALTDLKLRVAKPKGRPRNFNKTSQLKFSSPNNPGSSLTPKKQPKGLLNNIFQTTTEKREAKAQEIPDSALTQIDKDNWRVISQSNSNVSYMVSALSCDCPDKKKRKEIDACKHMLKVRVILSGTLFLLERHSKIVAIVIRKTNFFASSLIGPKLELGKTKFFIFWSDNCKYFSCGMVNENNEDEDVSCCVCSIGEPSHTCAICDKHVHSIPPCSDPCPDSEDGYGNKRICQVCKSGKQSRKRKNETDDDHLEQSQNTKTTRYGRKVVPKILFTPTKP